MERYNCIFMDLVFDKCTNPIEEKYAQEFYTKLKSEKNDVLLDKNQNCFIIKNNNKNNELLEKYNYVDFTLISLSEVCNMYLLLKDKYIKINESITLYGGDCLKIFKVYDKKNISFVTNLFNTNCNDPLKQLENLIIKTTLVKAIDDINNLLLKY